MTQRQPADVKGAASGSNVAAAAKQNGVAAATAAVVPAPAAAAGSAAAAVANHSPAGSSSSARTHPSSAKIDRLMVAAAALEKSIGGLSLQPVVPAVAAAPAVPASAAAPATAATNGALADQPAAPSKNALKRAKKAQAEAAAAAAIAAAASAAPAGSSGASSPALLVVAPAVVTLSLEAQKSAAAAAPAANGKPVAAAAPASNGKHAVAPAAVSSSAPVTAPSSAASAAGGARLSATSLPLCLPMDRLRNASSSSTVATATALAHTFIAWMRDVTVAQSQAGAQQQQRPRRTFLLEIGAGANYGKSAYQFLVALSQRVNELPFAVPPSAAAAAAAASGSLSPLALLTPFASQFTYILADPLQSNLDNLRMHPQLAPFIDVGLVDVALFDPTAPLTQRARGGKAGESAAAMELMLQTRSQLLLSTAENEPMFCVCNEQMTFAAPAASSAAAPASRAAALTPSRWKFDAFTFQPTSSAPASAAKGVLQELLADVKPSSNGGVSPASVHWNARTLSAAELGSYYPQPEMNAVLARYVSRLDEVRFPSFASPAVAPTAPISVDKLPARSAPVTSAAAAAAGSAPTSQTFTIPTTACTLLTTLRGFAAGALVLVVLERGFNKLVTLPNQRPSLGFTPSAKAAPSSAPANLPNLHALGALAEELGGSVLAQPSDSVSQLRVTLLEFPSRAEERRAAVAASPAVNASPVKSALKGSNGIAPVAPAAASEVVASVESAAEDAESKKSVRFAGLNAREAKALKRAELEAQAKRATQLQQQQSSGSRDAKRLGSPPFNLRGAFYSQFQWTSPFVPASDSADASSLSLSQALSVLCRSQYELETFAKLKSLFLSPIPCEGGRRRAGASTLQPYYASSPMEGDTFLAFSRVWLFFFALPSDIYAVLPGAANLDLAFELAAYYTMRRRYRTAIALYKRSVELFGPHAVTYCNIALCHIHVREYTAAREALRQSLSLDPSYAQASAWSAWVEAQVGSAEDVHPALSLDLDASRTIDEQAGEADEAEAEAEEAAEQPEEKKQQQEPKQTKATESKHAKNTKPAAAAAAVAPPVSAPAPAPLVPAAAPAAPVASSPAPVEGATAEERIQALKDAQRAKTAAKREAQLAAKKAAAAAAAAAASVPVPAPAPAAGGVVLRMPSLRFTPSAQPPSFSFPSSSVASNGVRPSTAPAVSVPTVSIAKLSTPSSSSASSALSSYLLPSPNQAWADLEDDDEPMAVTVAAAAPSTSKLTQVAQRVVTKQPQQQTNGRGAQQAQGNGVAAHTNGAAKKPQQAAQNTQPPPQQQQQQQRVKPKQPKPAAASAATPAAAK